MHFRQIHVKSNMPWSVHCRPFDSKLDFVALSCNTIAHYAIKLFSFMLASQISFQNLQLLSTLIYVYVTIYVYVYVSYICICTYICICICANVWVCIKIYDKIYYIFLGNKSISVLDKFIWFLFTRFSLNDLKGMKLGYEVLL